jgi:hypothetical protein
MPRTLLAVLAATASSASALEGLLRLDNIAKEGNLRLDNIGKPRQPLAPRGGGVFEEAFEAADVLAGYGSAEVHLLAHARAHAGVHAATSAAGALEAPEGAAHKALALPRGGKALAVSRGGATVDGVIEALAYASSAFIFLPAGRDIVSNGTAILPGEAETRPLMTMADPSARAMTWGMWGLNHCFITALKLLAIKAKDKAMLKMLTVLTAIYVPLLLVGQKEMGPLGGDVGGFVAICAVQTLTLGYLAK